MIKSSQNSGGNLICLSLKEIAKWKLTDQFDNDSGSVEVRAILPALQRGAVWSVEQTEKLWDSIIRGFPIGSFLITPYKSSLGRKQFSGAKAEIVEPNYCLLDGQQRAAAVAAGFYNPWQLDVESKKERDDQPILWCDLAPLERMEQGDDRRYAFRMITRSNPWGFSRSKPNRQLEAKKMRSAILAWKSLCGVTGKPHKFALWKLFPWDVVAPVPLAFLLEAVDNYTNTSEMARSVLKKMENLPFWSQLDLVSGSNKTEKSQETEEANEKFRKAHDLLTAIYNGGEDGNGIFDRLRDAVRNQRVPAVVYDDHKGPEDENKSEKGENQDSKELSKDSDTDPSFENDDIAILFNRVNSAGTELNSEEMNYTLLKAAWPEAAEAIEDRLLKDHKLMRPKRLVALLTRLLEVEDTAKSKTQREKIPPISNVTRFRRLMRKDNLEKRLKDFCKEGEEAKRILEGTWNFLTSEKFGLPSYLAERISAEAGDIMFVLMYWTWKTKNAHEMDEETMRRTLGFITAIVWFMDSSAVRRCAQTLWEELRHDPSTNFFNRERFLKILRLKDDKLQMIPLAPPEEVRYILKGRILSPIQKAEAEQWGNNIWELTGKIIPKEYDDFVRRIIKNTVRENEGLANYKEILLEKYHTAWWAFIDSSWHLKKPGYSLLIYAQRQWLFQTWFDWYDPTLPEQTERRNQPWDYDHIVPQSLSGKHNIKQLVREAIKSVGNQRAWPMELNRSDRDDGPEQKLHPTGEHKPMLAEYNIKRRSEILDASFIEGDSVWSNWKHKDDSLKEGFKSGEECARYFVEAVIDRYVRLYENWYRELRIEDLMPQSE